MRKTKREMRDIRHARVRKKVKGRNGRYRINVFKSNKYIYAQVIDDDKGITVASYSDLKFKDTPEFAEHKPVERAKMVGLELGKICIEKGYENVVFDRGGYKYHGRVKALADGMRESGLKF